MKSLSPWLVLLAALTFACGGEESDHDHDEDDGHSHDGDAGGGDDEHGPRTELGTLDLEGNAVVFARYGDRKVGSDVPVDVELPEGLEAVAVRVWYGSEGGVGSMKAKLELEDGRHHGHVDLPTASPVGSAWWIEIDRAEGNLRGSIADG